jgi:hypothetical protein
VGRYRIYRWLGLRTQIDPTFAGVFTADFLQLAYAMAQRSAED